MGNDASSEISSKIPCLPSSLRATWHVPDPASCWASGDAQEMSVRGRPSPRLRIYCPAGQLVPRFPGPLSAKKKHMRDRRGSIIINQAGSPLWILADWQTTTTVRRIPLYKRFPLLDLGTISHNPTPWSATYDGTGDNGVAAMSSRTSFVMATSQQRPAGMVVSKWANHTIIM